MLPNWGAWIRVDEGSLRWGVQALRFSYLSTGEEGGKRERQQTSRSTNLETLDVTSVDLHFFAVYIVVRAALKRFIEHALNQQQLSAVLVQYSTAPYCTVRG